MVLLHISSCSNSNNVKLSEGLEENYIDPSQEKCCTSTLISESTSAHVQIANQHSINSFKEESYTNALIGDKSILSESTDQHNINSPKKESSANTLISDQSTSAESIEQYIDLLKGECCANSLIGDSVFDTQTKSQGIEQHNMNSSGNIFSTCTETTTSRLNEKNSVGCTNTDCLIGEKISNASTKFYMYLHKIATEQQELYTRLTKYMHNAYIKDGFVHGLMYSKADVDKVIEFHSRATLCDYINRYFVWTHLYVTQHEKIGLMCINYIPLHYYTYIFHILYKT